MSEKIIETYISVNKDSRECNFANKMVKKVISLIVSTRLTAILFMQHFLRLWESVPSLKACTELMLPEYYYNAFGLN